MGSAGQVRLDVKQCCNRIKKIFQYWEGQNLLQDLDALSFAVGNNEILSYNKTSAIQEWIFGYDLHDTLVFITKKKIFIVTSKKKASFLEPMTKGGLSASVEIIARNRDVPSSEQQYSEIGDYLQKEHGSTTPVVGVFEKDRFEGPFVESWYQYFKQLKVSKRDVSNDFAILLSVKEEVELTITKQAAGVCSELYTQFVKSYLLKIIDAEKKVKHSKISEAIENALESKKYMLPGMSVEEVEVCYPPIIQSGGNYSLKFSAISDNNIMQFDHIISFIGVRYKYYCSSLVRTIMVEPSQEAKDLYEFCLKLHDLVVSNIQPGNKFCDSYCKAYELVKATYPQYLANFVRNAGFVTGLEFRENSLLLDSKNTNIIQNGMVFCTLIGFQNITLPRSKPPKPLSFAIGDTVVASSDNNKGQVLTTSKKMTKSCTVLLNDDESNSIEAIDDDMLKRAPTVLQSRKRPHVEVNNNEDQRKVHQAELKKKLNEEARRRLLNNEEVSGTASNLATMNVMGSYKSPHSLPKEPDIINLKLYVDRRAEAVILPIFGMSVPFHISTIKNVSSNVEGNHTYLRINFNVLTSSSGKGEDLSTTYGKNVYVKEMVYRSSNSKDLYETAPKSSNLLSAFHAIKEAQKAYKSRALEKQEMEGVVKQANLIINSSKTLPRLKDLAIRPQIGARRVSGVLEAHVNGFRYVSSRGDHVDILYENLKHSLFQPCDGEVVITLHFHLKSPIIIGKKKYRDVQFYTECGEVTSDLGKSTSSMLDRDEIEAEEAECEARNKLKLMFKAFIERVETISNHEVEFDVPFRELGFFGVPHKSSVFLMPTTHCLINITDQPAFIISLEDIELVHFERVVFHMKQIDMVIVFKDYRRKVCNISCVPMNYLDPIKDWLNSCDIKFTESTQNLNWPKIMKTILDDPEEFFSTGGWGFLDPESSEGEAAADEEEVGDEEYQPEVSDDEYGDGDSSDSEDYESESSDGSDGGGGGNISGEDVESESGKSWSELEEEARAMDALKHGDAPPASRKRALPTKNSQSKTTKLNRHQRH